MSRIPWAAVKGNTGASSDTKRDRRLTDDDYGNNKAGYRERKSFDGNGKSDSYERRGFDGQRGSANLDRKFDGQERSFGYERKGFDRQGRVANHERKGFDGHGRSANHERRSFDRWEGSVNHERNSDGQQRSYGHDRKSFGRQGTSSDHEGRSFDGQGKSVYHGRRGYDDRQSHDHERRSFGKATDHGKRTFDDHRPPKRNPQVRVLNIPLNVTEENISKLFSEAGNVHYTKLLPPKDGRETCAGFVTFGSEEETIKAINDFDGYEIEGFPLKVFKVTQPNERKSTSDEKGGECGHRTKEHNRGEYTTESTPSNGRSSFKDTRRYENGGDDMMDLSVDRSHQTRDVTQRAPVTYIPPPLPEDEHSIFDNSCHQGINFDKYEEIPVNVSGRDPPRGLDDFSQADLDHVCFQNIKLSNFKKPTPVQKFAIPVILKGRDLMACAQTGSGKTAAFLLPLITKLLEAGLRSSSQDVIAEPAILILVPTRELAVQIHKEARRFAYGTQLRCVVVYGGVSVHYQLEVLSEGCDLLVATPGRIADFILRRKVSLTKTEYLVLDEADRMVDMGFGPQIEQIMETGELIPKGKRQTLMFSATFPDDIQKMAGRYLDDYLFLAVGIVGGTCTDITQAVIEVPGSKKRDKLEEILLDSGTDKTLVFVETKRNADFLASFLSQRDFPATSLNGDRTQQEREIALREFTKGSATVLVATAVAARGLDIPDVKHVVNYDLPAQIDEYVHRVGRTGRIGNKGQATAFFEPGRDDGLARSLVKVLSEANQVVPSWLEEAALTATGTPYGPEGGQFTSKDSRMVNGGRGTPRQGDRSFKGARPPFKSQEKKNNREQRQRQVDATTGERRSRQNVNHTHTKEDDDDSWD